MTCWMKRARVVAGSSSRSRHRWPIPRQSSSIASLLKACSGNCLMRDSAETILAIRGLLLVGDFSTTILTGGYDLRKCSKSSYGAELRINLMALRNVPLSALVGMSSFLLLVYSESPLVYS